MFSFGFKAEDLALIELKGLGSTRNSHRFQEL